MLSQREIDRRSGNAKTFWSNVDAGADGKWCWTGVVNNNHNTVDCESYDYGEFELTTDESSNLAKPKRRIKTKMAHRVAVYLSYGVEVPAGFDVFPKNGDHLDLNPLNLWVRSKTGRQEWSAAEFCASNDNAQAKVRVVA